MAQKKAKAVLRRIEKMAQTRFLPIVGPLRGAILAQAVADTKPKRVLEVGTLIGYSAILIAMGLKPDTELITIEIDADEAEEARRNIAEAGVRSNVAVITGDAIKVLRAIKGMFDLVFIDAEKAEYYDYLRIIESHLHEGSVIVADNAGIFADQMAPYLEYVRESGKFSSRFVNVGDDGVEVSIRL